MILVEDPGQLNPENPYGYADEWELIDLAYKDDILRLGMALSKDYPNILTRAKVEGFFDSSFFLTLMITGGHYSSQGRGCMSIISISC